VTAWELQERRARGERIPSTCLNPATLQYAAVARFGEQLQRLYEAVPREQVHVVVYDDFRRDPGAAYEAVLSFLGVPSDGRESFERVNVRKKERSRVLGRMMKRSPFGVWRRFKRATGIEARWLKQALLRLNSSPVESSAVTGELRDRMREAFAEDVALLGRLLDRDLNHWLAPV
jgi:hypothetical protein